MSQLNSPDSSENSSDSIGNNVERSVENSVENLSPQMTLTSMLQSMKNKFARKDMTLIKYKGTRYNYINRRQNKNKMASLSRNDLKRLARRGGVKRISKSSYHEINLALTKFLRDVIEKSIVYTEYGRRKTVTPEDICRALKSCKNITYYGGF